MKLTLISAHDENRLIGGDNTLIWDMPTDMRHFVQLTKGHAVIMGRKTLESMDKKPLPKRTNIVITRNKAYEAPGCIVVGSLQEALQAAGDDDQPFVIGGAQIYAEAIKLADCLEITVIHHRFEGGDSWFPEYTEKEWKIVKKEEHPASEKDPYPFTFITLERK